MISPLAAALIERHPAAAARVLEMTNPEVVGEILDLSPKAAAAKLLAAMNPRAAAAPLAQLAPDAAASRIAGLGIEQAAILLRLLAPDASGDLLRKLPAKTAVPLRMVLRFPAGCIGALVDPRVITAHPDTRLGEVAEISRHMPQSLRRYVYVLEDGKCLAGVLDARDCVLQDPDRPVSAFVRKRPNALRARMSWKEAALDPGWERFSLLPVTDGRGNFLGVLRRRRLQQALAEAGGGEPPENLAELALELADLYWNASAGLLVSALGEKRKS